MANKKSNSAMAFLVIGGLCLLAGIVLVAVSLILNDGTKQDTLVYDIMLYGGAGLGVLGFIVAVAAIVSSGKKNQKQKAAKSQQPQAENMGDVELSLDGTATYNGQTVEYIPNQETYEFVNMGKRQSIDDKFDQIGKMGKTQFVIYVAKLFSLKGYEVQLTPVADNHDIDMIIKKEGKTRAVGCLLANKVLSAQDVKAVNEGKDFYQAAAAMSVTNMFFDRSALDYAKSHGMALVDRNVLAEEYMR